MTDASMELDKRDRLILACLDADCRTPLSGIAKKLRISKESVHYRIAELERKGIIRQYYAIIDTAKMGFYSFKLYVEFQNVDEAAIREMLGFVAKDQNVYWLAHTTGKFDMMIGFWAKNQMEFDAFIGELMTRYGPFIGKKQFTITKYNCQASRRWLSDAQESSQSTIGGAACEPKLDALDWKIASEIAKNARVPYSNVAQRCGCTPATVISRAKRMEREGVISASRIQVNLELLGMDFYKLFIVFREKSDEFEKKFVVYCLVQKQILNVVTCVGPWDAEVEVEARNLRELHDIALGIRKKWKKYVKTVEMASVVSEEKLLFLPSAPKI